MKVYQFFISQMETEEDWVDPGYKATRAHLDAMANVKIKIIESSEEEVDASKLDPDGRYFP